MNLYLVKPKTTGWAASNGVLCVIFKTAGAASRWANKQNRAYLLAAAAALRGVK